MSRYRSGATKDTTHRRTRSSLRKSAVKLFSSSLPPSMSIRHNETVQVVQAFWDVYQAPAKVANPTKWFTNVTSGWILAQDWKSKFASLFQEMKVDRIRCHFVPYVSITSLGEYVFTLGDYLQNMIPDSFEQAVGMPSSVVRKSGHPACLTWYPTEPDDRNWVYIGSQHIWCSVTLFQSESNYNVAYPTTSGPLFNTMVHVGIQGKIIVESVVRFRGKSDPPHATGSAHSDAPSVAPRNCYCSKCARGLLKTKVHSTLSKYQAK